jgi:Cu/Ag efflux protein CusF
MKTRRNLPKTTAALAVGFVIASGLTPASPALSFKIAEMSATPIVQLLQAAFAPAAAMAQSLVEGKGKVIAVTQEKQELVLEHGEIKGFMDPMTMGYKVSSPALLKGLKAGDQVHFTIDKNKSVITKITKLKSDQINGKPSTDKP